MATEMWSFFFALNVDSVHMDIVSHVHAIRRL